METETLTKIDIRKMTERLVLNWINKKVRYYAKSRRRYYYYSSVIRNWRVTFLNGLESVSVELSPNDVVLILLKYKDRPIRVMFVELVNTMSYHEYLTQKK